MAPIDGQSIPSLGTTPPFNLLKAPHSLKPRLSAVTPRPRLIRCRLSPPQKLLTITVWTEETLIVLPPTFRRITSPAPLSPQLPTPSWVTVTEVLGILRLTSMICTLRFPFLRRTPPLSIRAPLKESRLPIKWPVVSLKKALRMTFIARQIVGYTAKTVTRMTHPCIPPLWPPLINLPCRKRTMCMFRKAVRSTNMEPTKQRQNVLRKQTKPFAVSLQFVA